MHRALDALWAALAAARRRCEAAGDPELGTAAQAFPAFPTLLVVDGDRFAPYISPASGDFVPHACVVDGDAKYLSIAAASVLAKTHRDRHVAEVLHPRFPAYGWDRSKCYGTPAHLAKLAELGPCPEHRRTFAPVQRAAARREQDAQQDDGVREQG
jgi:ribonuclease HII